MLCPLCISVEGWEVDKILNIREAESIEDFVREVASERFRE